MKRWIGRALALALLIMSGVPFVQAQEQAAQPCAFAILFYSPTCPACHNYIENDLPALQETFGDQLEILFFDVSTEGGSYWAQQAYETFDVPRENWAVPMMIIQDQVMVGGDEIPARAAPLIQQGISAGCFGLPPIPGLQDLYDEYMAAQAATASDSSDDEAAGAVAGDDTAGSAGDEAASASAGEDAAEDVAPTVNTIATDEISLAERLAQDPIANAAAVVVLGALIVSLFGVGVAVLRGADVARFARPAAIAFVIAGALVTASLLFDQDGSDSFALVAAVMTLIGLVAALIMLFTGKGRDWDGAVPVIALSGVIVAAYLAYVEMTQVTASCGLVGNCNAVQQSEYATLFGLIPVGVAGVIGYLVVAGLWLVARQRPTLRPVLIFVATVGVAFSAYLTFLEPFVIGATCAWCLVSALLMGALLWLSPVVPTTEKIGLYDEGHSQEVVRS